MTLAERQEALRVEAVEYGEAKARAGFWSRGEAVERAREEIEALVGPDPGARGHAFFLGVDDGDRRVGWLWCGPVPGSETSRRKRWLFQIVVDEALRGHGYGRALLAAAERRLAGEGVRELSLNVFRGNTVAVHLYRASGYEVTFQGEQNLEMRKRLGPP